MVVKKKSKKKVKSPVKKVSKKPVKKRAVKKVSRPVKNIVSQSSEVKKQLFGIKIITLILLLYALYSFILVVLYLFSIFVDGPIRDNVLSAIVDQSYLEYFVNTYGEMQSINFFLLIGAFLSLITFLLNFWFSWSLWKHKNWARITISIFSVILFFVSIFDLIFAGYSNTGQVIWMILYAFVPIYLLLNKHVVRVFSG
ncbi:hypothetical protein GOV12_03055 [Candidatus Pacearchaeota archaeon]|nr:hypothetical protein [Candidatus Pacearchaeota archaeon]